MKNGLVTVIYDEMRFRTFGEKVQIRRADGTLGPPRDPADPDLFEGAFSVSIVDAGTGRGVRTIPGAQRPSWSSWSFRKLR